MELTGELLSVVNIHCIKDLLQRKAAYWPVYKSIEKQFSHKFLIGGAICTKHRLAEQKKVLTGDYDMNVQDEEYSLPPMSSMNTGKEELDSFLEFSTYISPVKFQMVSPLESY